MGFSGSIQGERLGGAILLLALLCVAATAGAAPGFGRATIDGVRDAPEWFHADARPIFSGPLAGSTLFVMNDGDNLYLGVEVVGDADLTAADFVVVRFDNDLDLVLTQNDDRVELSTSSLTDSYFDTGLGDWSPPDMIQNGQGAAARLSGVNFFEIEKPLASGDVRDFDLQGGSVVGFCLRYFFDGSSNPDGQHLANCVFAVNEQTLYDQIEVVPALSALGTAVADGVKSPGEWDAAATRTIFGGAYAGSTLYVMNDGVDLHVAVEIVGDADLTGSDRVVVRFDEDVDLALTLNDDEFSWVASSGNDTHWEPGGYTPDGLQNGASAAARSGGTNFFELSKPLDSGDAQDFSLAPGDRVGLCVRYFINGTVIGDTRYPSSCDLTAQAQLRYDMLVVAGSNALPGLSPPGVVFLALVLLTGVYWMTARSPARRGR